VDNGPDKPVEEMTERETREWKEWLFAQGADPAPIREEASLSVPAYGWDKDRKAVIESVHGQRFLVKLENGGLCRGPLLEAEVKSPGLNRFKVHKNSIQTSRARKRKFA
jgi:hypothetical protein